MTFQRRRVFAGLVAEITFATLPLLVVFIVLLRYDRGGHIASSPEWAFGAAILFGQALVKFMTGLAHGGKAAYGPMSLAAALIIVLGLAPSLLVLTLVLLDLEAAPGQEPARPLPAAQVALFLLSAATYFVFGAVGEMWRHRGTVAVAHRITGE
jgi:hypothetical protein